MENKNVENLTSIPNFSRYLFKLNQDGNHQIFDTLKNKNLKITPQKTGYKTVRLIDDEGNAKSVYLHRLIAAIFLQSDPKKNTVDHINRNCLDNRLCNLRYATRSEQLHNRDFSKSGGYAGTTWHKTSKKWRATITVNGESKILGLFEDRQEAHEAYIQASKKYYPGIKY